MRFAALVLTTAGLLPLSAAALSLDDARAVRARQFRLMVAALKCDDHALYNPVVNRHHGLFSQAEHLLRARRGEQHDHWGTKMANQDSRHANGLGDDAYANA